MFDFSYFHNLITTDPAAPNDFPVLAQISGGQASGWAWLEGLLRVSQIGTQGVNGAGFFLQALGEGIFS